MRIKYKTKKYLSIQFLSAFAAVMRLGKRKEKEKDHSELKSQGVEGITRLICLSKGQNPLKGMIDYNFV